eukprot:7988286-Alexandrium_andersonii.AAC.1
MHPAAPPDTAHRSNLHDLLVDEVGRGARSVASLQKTARSAELDGHSTQATRCLAQLGSSGVHPQNA